VELDTDQLETLVKQRDWSHATPLINGPFLFGFKIPDSSSFEDWLTVERSHWDGLCIDTLLRHAEERLDAGDELSADEPITKARKLDPLSQRAVRTEMRRLAGTDNRSEALHVFDDFVNSRNARGGWRSNPRPRRWSTSSQRAGWHLPKDVASRRVPLLGRDRELGAATRAVAPRASRATGAPLIEAESVAARRASSRSSRRAPWWTVES